MISRMLVLFLIHLIFQFTHSKLFFRKDYSYIDEANAFYKIHALPKTRDEAILTCEREGATLFYPGEESEVVAVTEHWTSIQRFIHSVLVNINKTDIISTEGEVIAGVYANWEEGEPNSAGGQEDCVVLNDKNNLNDVNCNSRYPFICKKTNQTVEWNEACNMAYPGYMFDKEQGRCYKFHSNPRNWNDAYAICYGELSYLAIIDNEIEATHLMNLTNNSNKELLPEIETTQIHLGFFNRDGWITIQGVPLHLSGYNKWAQFQPDGGLGEDCGAMSSDGLLHDIPCSQKMYFICEHEVPNN